MQRIDSSASSPGRAGRIVIGLSAFPEGTVEILRERLDEIGQRRAFAGAYEHLDGHPRNDGMSGKIRKLARLQRHLRAYIRRSARLVGQRVGRDAGGRAAELGR